MAGVGFEPTGVEYDPSVPYKDPEKRRAASRRHYAANAEDYKKRAKVHTELERERVSAFLHNLKDVPCADCNGLYPYYVMQFDHVQGDKLFNLGDARRLGYSLERVWSEAAKCEVVCANCHAVRTYLRRGNE